MSHNDGDDPTADAGDAKVGQQAKPLDNDELLLNAVTMLLSDLCLCRFRLLMVTEQDPTEAAKEVIDSLDRYDFLSNVAASNISFPELKKQIESDIGNEAESVIREQNPR